MVDRPGKRSLGDPQVRRRPGRAGAAEASYRSLKVKCGEVVGDACERASALGTGLGETEIRGSSIAEEFRLHIINGRVRTRRRLLVAQLWIG
jgi:hypothetical protein